ncbi:hypothetical protein QOZ95_003075 [Paenibacillus brasilensis]|uniref:Uncharacterized protein n=1 Tax=Paenibacillus brasilensis TaxID=128574 RepID=A0ABU0KZP9_9BACL|nr:hypothetical protein [Paenibacillus brasilensis]
MYRGTTLVIAVPLYEIPHVQAALRHLFNGRAIALFSLVTGASRRVQPALRNELSLLDKHI